MLIRLVYQKCIKNGLTGNDIPSHLLYCLASRNTRNLWMMTSHSKKKRESRKVDQKQERWTRNSRGHSATYIRERKYHFAQNGQQIEYQQECYI